MCVEDIWTPGCAVICQKEDMFLSTEDMFLALRKLLTAYCQTGDMLFQPVWTFDE